MGNPIMNFAMNMIAKNPQISGNPQAQDLINIIKSGDSVKGEQIARNLCNSYGMSPEQALDLAASYFNIPTSQR